MVWHLLIWAVIHNVSRLIIYALGVVLAWLINYEKKQKSQGIEADKINTMENKTSAGIIIFTAVFSLISLNKKAREKRSDV